MVVPVMSAVERVFCCSAPWRVFARRVVLPWALDGYALTGDVLEIGSGSGAMAEGVVTRFSAVRLTVTDIDEAMVASARRRLTGHPNIRVEQADVTALPFPSASFDAVTSYLMLHHVINWREALHEVARVLRPEGVFFGYDLTDTRTARLTHRIDGSAHRIVGPEELRAGLLEAGFKQAVVDASAAGLLMRFRAEAAGGS